VFVNFNLTLQIT